MGQLKEISEKTLLPISIVLLVVSLAVHLTSVKSLGETNRDQIEQIKKDQGKINDLVEERMLGVERMLHKIDGKLDIILQKNK